MSIFFCQACQVYHDEAEEGLHSLVEGQFCHKSAMDRRIVNIESQVNENSIENLELNKRVKELEEKKCHT